MRTATTLKVSKIHLSSALMKINQLQMSGKHFNQDTKQNEELKMCMVITKAL